MTRDPDIPDAVRPLPRDDDAEVALLASVMATPSVAFDVAHLVDPGDFFDGSRGSLWSVIRALVDQRVAPDPVAIQTELVAVPVGDIDLPALARRLADLQYQPSNAPFYAKTVREKALLRQVVAATSLARDEALDGAPLDDVLGRLRAVVSDSHHAASSAARPMLSVVEEAFAELEGSADSQCVATGFTALDSMAGPIEAGSFVLLGARPSMGKTAFALNIAINVAACYGPVLFLSLEMPAKRLVRRLLSTTAGIPLERLRNGAVLSDEQHAALKTAKGRLVSVPLLIDDASSPSLDAVAARIRRHVERDGVRLVILDYLGLIREPSGRTINSRENVVGCISRGLRAAAKDAKVAMLALSQLNRESDRINRDANDAADTKPPTLSDLRDSGSLEQDADQVWFLHRPGYYTKRAGDDEAQVHIRKNRDGQTGVVRLTWDGRFQRFTDREIV